MKYISREVLHKLESEITKPEQGAVIFGRDNLFSKIVFLSNKAKNKNRNFNIGLKDRFRLVREMYKTKSDSWVFVHSHDLLPYLSETDLNTAKVGQTWGIISLKPKTLIFYDILKENGTKTFRPKQIYLEK